MSYLELLIGKFKQLQLQNGLLGNWKIKKMIKIECNTLPSISQP